MTDDTIDIQTSKELALSKHTLTDLAELKNARQLDSNLDSASNAEVKQFCKDYVSKLVALHLPKALAKNNAIRSVIDMQQSMHTMSLVAMITVVRNSLQLLSNLSTDDMYTPEGMLDPFKLQAILSTQQHVMDFVARFNAQIRQLPSIVQQMITDASIQQIIELNADEEQKQTTDTGKRSNVPLSVMLKQAASEASTNDFSYVKPPKPTLEGAEDIMQEQSGLAELDDLPTDND